MSGIIERPFDAQCTANVQTGNASVFSPAMLAVTRLQSPMVSWGELLHDKSFTGAAPWVTALAALQGDADAALPS